MEREVEMSVNREMRGGQIGMGAVRSNLAEFTLLIGGAVATACAVALVAMGVVLLLAR